MDHCSFQIALAWRQNTIFLFLNIYIGGLFSLVLVLVSFTPEKLSWSNEQSNNLRSGKARPLLDHVWGRPFREVWQALTLTWPQCLWKNDSQAQRALKQRDGTRLSHSSIHPSISNQESGCRGNTLRRDVQTSLAQFTSSIWLMRRVPKAFPDPPPPFGTDIPKASIGVS